MRLLRLTPAAVVLLLGLCLSPAFAANVTLDLVSSIGGDAVNRIAVQGDFAYCSSHYGLVIYDTSDPAHITRAGAAETRWAGNLIAVSGNYAYLKSTDQLLIFDVSDPANPVQVGSYGGWGEPSIDDMFVAGGYLYELGILNGFAILDVSDPAHPTQAYSTGWTSPAYCALALSGSYLYAADLAGTLHVFNVSFPKAASQVATYALPDAPAAMAASGGRLYTGHGDHGLLIWDISTPAGPKPLGSLKIAYQPGQIALSGDRAFIWEHVPIWEDLPHADIVHAIDVSNPSGPHEVGSFEATRRVSDFTVAGDAVYLAICGHGVMVVDMSHPAAPVEAGAALSTSGGYRMVIDRSYAYITGYAYADVVEISKPNASAYATSFPLHDFSPMAADGRGYLYSLPTLEAAQYGGSGLMVVDVSDPMHAEQAALLVPTDPFKAVAVSGRSAFVVDRAGAFRVLDISDPPLVHQVGQIGLTGTIYDLALLAVGPGDIAYVVASPSVYSPRLWVVDASTPTAPALVAQLAIDTSSVLSLALHGQHLYLGAGFNELLVVDVSQPTAPAVVGSLEWTHADGWVSVRSIDFVGNHAYAALQPEHPQRTAPGRPRSGALAPLAAETIEVASPQLAVIDVSTPGAPAEVGSYSFASEVPQATGVSGRYLYLSWCGRGLTVLSEGLFPDVPGSHWAFDAVMDCVDAGIVQGYSDGTYKPTDPVTRDQMAVYISRALVIPTGDAAIPDPVPPASFSDVSSTHWAYKHIEYAVSQNVVKGYDDGTYKPDLVVDRGQMAVFVARAMVTPSGDAGIPDPVPPATFSDVPDTFWAYKQVEYCVGQGVVKGYDDGTYRPTEAVTRDQMAVYVARAFKLPL